jgi:Ca2+/Na+ antiporter
MTSGIVRANHTDYRRVVMGTIVGGIVLYALGYVIFDVAVKSFYAANLGSATGVTREPQLIWALMLGTLAYGALVAFAIENRAGAVTVGGGVMIGALVGFLLWATADFLLYGATNISNLTRTVVDPLLEIVRAGVAGGVIVAVVGKRREVARQTRQAATV